MTLDEAIKHAEEVAVAWMPLPEPYKAESEEENDRPKNA